MTEPVSLGGPTTGKPGSTRTPSSGLPTRRPPCEPEGGQPGEVEHAGLVMTSVETRARPRHRAFLPSQARRVKWAILRSTMPLVAR
jgi:hypothetical protein